MVSEGGNDMGNVVKDSAAPQGWRPTFADEVPDAPQICNLHDHPAEAHKHAGIGKTWFYKPAAKVEQ